MNDIDHDSGDGNKDGFVDRNEGGEGGHCDDESYTADRDDNNTGSSISHADHDTIHSNVINDHNDINDSDLRDADESQRPPNSHDDHHGIEDQQKPHSMNPLENKIDDHTSNESGHGDDGDSFIIKFTLVGEGSNGDTGNNENENEDDRTDENNQVITANNDTADHQDGDINNIGIRRRLAKRFPRLIPAELQEEPRSRPSRITLSRLGFAGFILSVTSIVLGLVNVFAVKRIESEMDGTEKNGPQIDGTEKAGIALDIIGLVVRCSFPKLNHMPKSRFPACCRVLIPSGLVDYLFILASFSITLNHRLDNKTGVKKVLLDVSLGIQVCSVMVAQALMLIGGSEDEQEEDEGHYGWARAGASRRERTRRWYDVTI